MSFGIGKKPAAPPQGIFSGVRAKKLAYISKNDPQLFRAIVAAQQRNQARNGTGGQPTVRAQAINTKQALWRKQQGLLNS